MKILQFGAIVERDGHLVLAGFKIDPEGRTIFSDAHLSECVVDLVTERLMTAKKALVDARQIKWLDSIPTEVMSRA